jgi:hypothetical protein
MPVHNPYHFRSVSALERRSQFLDHFRVARSVTVLLHRAVYDVVAIVKHGIGQDIRASGYFKSYFNATGGKTGFAYCKQLAVFLPD